MAEFLVEIEIELPPSMPDDERTVILSAEAERGRELRDAGSIVRMWRVPGRRANVGLWEAADASELHELLSSLPVFPWMNHPGAAARRALPDARGVGVVYATSSRTRAAICSTPGIDSSSSGGL